MDNCYKPYFFQSGKYQGQSVEEVIFKDPAYIGILLSYRDNKNPGNALQRHLEVLLEKTPKTITKCPICGKRSVKYFLYLNNETVFKELVCCENPMCREKLQNNHPNDYLLPFKLSSLLVFKRKTLRKKVVSLFKSVLGLRGQVAPEKIYNIFFEATPTQTLSTQLEIKF